jgi:hypothetical protein
MVDEVRPWLEHGFWTDWEGVGGFEDEGWKARHDRLWALVEELKKRKNAAKQ